MHLWYVYDMYDQHARNDALRVLNRREETFFTVSTRSGWYFPLYKSRISDRNFEYHGWCKNVDNKMFILMHHYSIINPARHTYKNSHRHTFKTLNTTISYRRKKSDKRRRAFYLVCYHFSNILKNDTLFWYLLNALYFVYNLLYFTWMREHSNS